MGNNQNNRKIVSYVNYSLLQGTWYQILSTQKLKDTDITLEYIVEQDGTIYVKESFLTYQGYLHTRKGIVKILNEVTNSHYSVRFRGFFEEFEYKIVRLLGDKEYTELVLTDESEIRIFSRNVYSQYKNYLVESLKNEGYNIEKLKYTCYHLRYKHVRMDSFFILTKRDYKSIVLRNIDDKVLKISSNKIITDSILRDLGSSIYPYRNSSYYFFDNSFYEKLSRLNSNVDIREEPLKNLDNNSMKIFRGGQSCTYGIQSDYIRGISLDKIGISISEQKKINLMQNLQVSVDEMIKIWNEDRTIHTKIDEGNIIITLNDEFKLINFEQGDVTDEEALTIISNFKNLVSGRLENILTYREEENLVLNSISRRFKK